MKIGKVVLPRTHQDEEEDIEEDDEEKPAEKKKRKNFVFTGEFGNKVFTEMLDTIGWKAIRS